MIVDRIILKNFKRFRDQEIRFCDGITGIVGNNGTGKSSIVEAILFALYGVQATGISGDFIVSSSAPAKEACEVRLDFRVGGESYTVIRNFRKGKTVQHDARFYRESSLRATGVSQVETEVKRVLGMGPVDFRNTIYAAQKDLLTLLENTPGKRKEWFQKALGIDFLRTASDRLLKERIDGKEQDLHRKEGELEGFKGRRNPAELEALRASVATFLSKMGELDTRRDEQFRIKNAISGELARFTERKTEYIRLAEQRKSLDGEIERLGRQRGQVADQVTALAGLEREYQELERKVSKIADARADLESLRKQKTEAERLIAEQGFLEKERADLRNRADKIRTKIAMLEEDGTRLATLIAGLREVMKIGPEIPDANIETAITSRETTLNQTIGTLSARAANLAVAKKKLLADWHTIREAGSSGKCPLCRQMLGDHYGKIGEEFATRQKEIENEEVQVRYEQQRVAAEKGRIADQEPARHEIRVLSERIKVKEITETELAELLQREDAKGTAAKANAARITSLGYNETLFRSAETGLAGMERLHVEYVEAGKKIARGTVLRQQGLDLEAAIQTKQRQREELEKEITALAFDPAAGIPLEQAQGAAETALREIEADIARTREQLSHAREKIVWHEGEMAKTVELESMIAALREEIGLLKLTRSMIGEYVIYLMQVVRSRIEGEVSRIVGEITGGRYEQVLLDEDFNLLVRDIDDDYPISRFSGGEQDDIAVALRIALSRYLAELHQVHESTLLIFDEIFGSQDEERRNNLLRALRTQESRFPQIILISHITEMQGEFSNTLLVEMGNGLSSTIREFS